MSRYALAFTLAVSFSMPMVMQADDHDKHDGDHQRRYYDQSHRDYHQWNDDEDRNFNLFLGERHIQVHAWTRAKSREQQEYWKWRHEHPDAHR